MSDFAGPILGAVGAVVGGIYGGPAGAQAGWMVGSTIGGAYSASQKVIPGPKIGEVQQQTSQEGGPIPIVFGRSHPIAGNVIADGGPVIVKKRQRQGKGGPKVETESVFRTYAVGFCEGDVTFLKVWKNNTLVYDATDPEMAAENAAFLEYARFYGGSHGQMPDPDLEAIYGVGNTPAFRGRAYMVLSREDVTDQRGAWSQWKVVVFRSAVGSYTTPPYPLLTMDAIGVSSHALDPFVWLPPLDEVDVSSFALDGAHRDLIAKYEGEPEEIDITSHALSGEHRDLIARYAAIPEELDVEGFALDGVHKVIVIQYLNYEHEEIDVTSHALNGTHGPA